jgi:hypothetical protein
MGAELRTSVGFLTGGVSVADTVADALRDAGYEPTVESIGPDRWQAFVAGDVDGEEHAELTGLVRGVAWTLRTLAEAGML